MFLYTQGITSSNRSIKVAREEVNYYEAISKEQTKFLNAVNEASITCYREVYFADGDEKIVTEGLKEYWDKFINWLKKIRDTVIAFFKKWYQKIKEFLFGKQDTFKYKAIKELIDDKEKAKKLASFNCECEFGAYDYQPYFNMLNSGLKHELVFSDPDDYFMLKNITKNTNEVKFFYNFSHVDKAAEYWKGSAIRTVTLKDIKAMYKNIKDLPESIESLRKSVTKYIDKMIEKVEAMRKNPDSKYTPEIGNKIATYQTILNNFLKEAMKVSVDVEKNHSNVFTVFATKSHEYLLQ